MVQLLEKSRVIQSLYRIYENYLTSRALIRRNSGYLARQEMERIKLRLNDQPHRLEHYGFKVYSQNDEDGIVEELCRRLKISCGTFCEIGVGNGLECNSLYLLHKGWRGAWLEGNSEQRKGIESRFHSLLDTQRLALVLDYIMPNNINQTIERCLVSLKQDPAALDFLSIDIDGMDIYLLEALAHQPKIVCIEYNAKFPPPLKKRPVFNTNYRWKGTDYMGASLCALTDVAASKGYRLVGTNITGTNAFFVRNDLLNDEFKAPTSSEDLYNPPRYYLRPDHFKYDVGHPADFGEYEDLQ